MCCEADWKREVVHDHKWDFINVAEFHRTDLFTRLKYVFRYILLFKSIAVMGLDIFTAITMISSDHWTNTLTQKASEGNGIDVQFAIAKWVFVGCIIFSFLLYGYEFYKAKHVIQSRDIAYAFTNLQANDYFSFKNYDNFCLFCHIENSTKRKDDLAFFVFFTFKDWKRLLLADGPRQSINALLLYSFGTANGWQTKDIPAWWDKDLVTAMLLFSMIATVLIFAGSLVLLIAASVMYVPLLCYIQGNLKEYVCVKVDKRLAELIRKKQRQRAARAAALEKKVARDGGLRNSKGEFVNVSLQPTLPKIQLEEDDMSVKGLRGMGRSGSTDALGAFAAKDEYAYPPTLDYSSAPSPSPSPNGIYASSRDEYDYGSTTRLTEAAGPMGISYPPPSAIAPPSAYPRRGSENTLANGYGHGRITPSRSQTQLSNHSARSAQTGPMGLAYPPSSASSAMPTPASAHPSVSNQYQQAQIKGYPVRQQSQSQSQNSGPSSYRTSPPYPNYPNQTQSQQPIAAPVRSNSHTHLGAPIGQSQAGYGNDHARSASPTSYFDPRYQPQQQPQQPPPTRSYTQSSQHSYSTTNRQQQQHLQQPFQAVPQQSPGLAYDQPDTDHTSASTHEYENDPAPSYHTASPPRGQASAVRGHGYGDVHGWR